VIDLHTHVLAGLDDGPADLEGSLEIAKEAAENGVKILVATPHVRDDFPTTPREMMEAVATLHAALRQAKVEIELLPGAEIAFDYLPELGVEDLCFLGLAGNSDYLLIELPFFGWPLDAAERIEQLAAAGFTTVLAHPERNNAVQQSPRRLVELVELGALVQVTATSLTGGFGQEAARSSKALLDSGLVHIVASDTHRAGGRRAALGSALDTLRDPVLAAWLSEDVPDAIVRGTAVPPRPSRKARKKRGHAGTAANRSWH